MFHELPFDTIGLTELEEGMAMNRGLMVRIGLLALALHFGFLAAAGEDTPGLATEWRYPWPRENQIVLDGVWNVAWTDPDAATTLPEGLDALDWFEAELPAEAHWALYRAGKAPHPYAGQNAAAMRWVEDKSWWYRKRFHVPPDFRAEHIRLCAEGTDYYGHYWLNGIYLGRGEGAFGNTRFIAQPPVR